MIGVQPNLNPAIRTHSAHRFDLPRMCPISGNPQPGSVLIIRDGPDITSYDDVLTIYNREDFPRAPKARADPAADR